jgi:anti-sigma regulatory factor (Ser/Thr protein kinase)
MPFVGDLLSFDVPCAVQAPRMVRQALAAVHDGGWSFDDGLLVASELVTNAIQHSGCKDTDRLSVEVGHRDGNLMISVHDPGLSGTAASPVEHEQFGVGGRGLQIVEQLSVRWGAERPDGYLVWAELPVHVGSDPTPAPAPLV